MDTNWLTELFSWSGADEVIPLKIIEVEKNLIPPQSDSPKRMVAMPSGRISQPDFDVTQTLLASLSFRLKRLEAEFFDIIPVIRKLTRVNPDMSQALSDIVQLANTGFDIKFDPGVSADQVNAMRLELETAAKTWTTGTAGFHGIANKMFSQVMVGGAVANEWVPQFNRKGIASIFYLNPERIRFVYDTLTSKYIPFQLLRNSYFGQTSFSSNLIQLNPNTFKYYALNGDEDIPYGIPPYWAALEPINTQLQMVDNIKFVSSTLGLLGYMDVLMDKPDQNENESEVDYVNRLNRILDDVKTRVKQGFKDGVNVGYKEDHEFNFTSATKDSKGADFLFNLNEAQVASGLKFDSAFLGRSYGSGTEGMITILFTKMLSQLSNMQLVVAAALQDGFTLHLKMKGYKFDYLNIEFKKSTITDELKYQQAQEYKIKNQQNLYADGIISQETYADSMGYKKPDMPEPRLPLLQRAGVVGTDLAGTGTAGGQPKKRADQKDASDRKQRDKEKPQGSKNPATKTRP